MGSDVTALCTSAFVATPANPCSPGNSAARPFLVAYLAKNPNAQYIAAQQGAFATAGRNTLRLPGINNVDLALTKRFNIRENATFEFGAQMLNFFNHPQFVPGLINDVASAGNTTTAITSSLLNPASSGFMNSKAVFNSNARSIGFSAKVKF